MVPTRIGIRIIPGCQVNACKQQFPIPKANSKADLFPRISFGLSWLIILPAAVWGISSYYLPLLAGTLGTVDTWVVTLVILLLSGISLVCHTAAHLWSAWLVEKKLPSKMTLLIFGDAAQRWPNALTGGREILVASAGPLVNLVLAGLAFLVWNIQTVNTVNVIALFLCGFNTWLFIINLIPVFPLDGGRILKGRHAGHIDSSGKGRLEVEAARVNGRFCTGGMGNILILQHLRFSLATGLITYFFILIMVDGLRISRGNGSYEAVRPERMIKHPWARILGAGLLCLVMLATASSLLLTNDGLDAPGVALSIEPMVNIPAQYRHSFSGQFFLVTVISQAPITAGEWVLGKIDPAMQVVPPETVTPTNTSPQKQASQDFQMLNDSETTAIAVGLQLAGYPDVAVGKGARVNSILPGSHATGLLQAGDIIVGLNGKAIQTTADLISGIQALSVQEPARLQVERGQTKLNVDVPLIPPTSQNGTPKLGIQVEQAGYDYNPPFPVSIQTDKISGGPSAGLMFTLTVYDTLTGKDLTGGRKIAGTGTINLDGSVGPIGGVKQKIFAAEAVGATYFLCPVDNYADAVSVATSIKVIKIATVNEALGFLRSLPTQ